jgi:hypothetical protein
MPRVLVVDDNGTVTWNERVTTEDLETEHFRRCLSERLSRTVADAYVQHRAEAFRQLPEARQRLERHANPMPGDRSGPMLWAQREVEALLARRHPFGEIEAWIDSLPLTDDQRAALWLLAWAEQDDRTRRRLALQTPGHVADA